MVVLPEVEMLTLAATEGLTLIVMVLLVAVVEVKQPNELVRTQLTMSPF